MTINTVEQAREAVFRYIPDDARGAVAADLASADPPKATDDPGETHE